jgi:2-polyprenyl-6-methoxyphenol hydroxylase-like FAD-dependent oxidoreductase
MKKIFQFSDASVTDFINRRFDMFSEKRQMVGARSILVVGGGPSGLAFATSLAALNGGPANISVCDARWTKDAQGLVIWKGRAEGVNRREQVVTLQSMVTDRLPAAVQEALFPEGGFDTIWPTGGESPEELGPPRNIRILDIEDRLLILAQDMGITLVADRIHPETLEIGAYDLIVMADGPRSQMREYFIDRFGAAAPSPYSINGTQVEDVVLGLRVTTRMAPADQVVMTIIQQRLLMNVTGSGEGYLYMRLTADEAMEVRGRAQGASTYSPCIQAHPCVMRLRADGQFGCETHGTIFAPAKDPTSFLWPRVQEALRLFDVHPDDLHEVTAFRLKMDHRPRFVAELSETGVQAPVFGALIGDAANSIHFWPGRGLNHGLSSAVSLARTVVSTLNKGTLRLAYFAQHEAAMHALQMRHKDRAWRNMVHLHDGMSEPYAEGFARVLQTPTLSRAEAIHKLSVRIKDFSGRIAPRLGEAPDVAGLIARLDYQNDESLALLAELGPWETFLSGGPEIDLDALNPANDKNVDMAA